MEVSICMNEFRTEKDLKYEARWTSVTTTDEFEFCALQIPSISTRRMICRVEGEEMQGRTKTRWRAEAEDRDKQ